MNRRELLQSIPVMAAGGLVLGAADENVANRARLRSALCAYSYRNELKDKSLSYADLVRIAVENGADGIDMTVYWMPDNPPDDFLLPLRRLAYKNAVEIYSIAIRTDMCRPTPQEQDAEVAKVKAWVEVAGKLGAGHIRVFGGAVPKGATEDQAAGYAAEVLKRSAEYAGRKGIILGIENHGGITEKAERIIQIVKAADSPWVGINLDTGNFQSRAFAQMEMCIPYAVNVQVKSEMRNDDGTRTPQDWERVAQMLVKGGYRGYLALEYEAKEPAATAVPRLLRKLADLVRKHSPS